LQPTVRSGAYSVCTTSLTYRQKSGVLCGIETYKLWFNHGIRSLNPRTVDRRPHVPSLKPTMRKSDTCLPPDLSGSRPVSCLMSAANALPINWAVGSSSATEAAYGPLRLSRQQLFSVSFRLLGSSENPRNRNDCLPTFSVGQGDRRFCLGFRREPLVLVGRERSSMSGPPHWQGVFCIFVKFSVASLEEPNPFPCWPPVSQRRTAATICLLGRTLDIPRAAWHRIGGSESPVTALAPP
jgi:hypothetical protein